MMVADLVRTALQLVAAALLIAGVAEVWHLAAAAGRHGCGGGVLRPLVHRPGAGGRRARPGCSRPTPCRGWSPAGRSRSAPRWPACRRGGGPGLGHRHRRAQLPRERRVPLAAAAGAVPGAAAAGRPRGRPAHAPRRRGAGARPTPPVSARRGFFRDLAAGWHEFRRHTWIWVTVIGAAAFLFAVDGPLQVLGPIVATRRVRRRPHLGSDVRRHGHRADRRRSAGSALAPAAADPRHLRRHVAGGASRSRSWRWRLPSGRCTRPWSPSASSGGCTTRSG